MCVAHDGWAGAQRAGHGQRSTRQAAEQRHPPLGSSGPSCSVMELKALGCWPLSPPRGRPSGICSPVFLLMEGGTLGAGGVEKGGGRFAKLCRVLCVRTSRVGYRDVGGCGRLVRHSCSATAVTMCVNGHSKMALSSVRFKKSRPHFISTMSISGAPRPTPGSRPYLVRSKPGGSGQAAEAGGEAAGETG